jgi:hypothetical protein
LLKGGGQAAADVKALSGAELIGSDDNLGLWSIKTENYKADVQYGLSSVDPIPNYAEDTQGNKGWKTVGPSGDDRGKPVPSGPGKAANPLPGGGWGGE